MAEKARLPHVWMGRQVHVLLPNGFHQAGLVVRVVDAETRAVDLRLIPWGAGFQENVLPGDEAGMWHEVGPTCPDGV